VREALELINTAQVAAAAESREGAKKLALQQQVPPNKPKIIEYQVVARNEEVG
jgi:hypothetical protein